MKKCRRCSKPATLHITEIQEGVVQELHLCESCAHAYLSGPNATDADSDADELPFNIADDQRLEEMDRRECPNCGITFKEFRKQGRLGCPHDYISFEAELLPLLENIHGDVQHVGKVPKRSPDASQRQYRLIRLRNDLRLAVGNEKYEEAAHLRDQIQALEVELNEPRTTAE